MIRRFPGGHPGRSAAVVHDGRVFAVVTAPEKEPSLLAQTRGALRALDTRLEAAGSHRSLVLSATVYITDMSQKAEMNQAWLEWVDMENPPQRACLGVALEGEDLVEITVVAALREG
ncbi:Enamine deaminase RidA, house cleaning of reactive enamine intermediates, YjgF/YER057c/UK114 family [Roseomonas rosea]|uniref:Enamine deaminase RidA, house cleaning of reactive enamine intermediates, YjgF/YER057c/UK114 family n=1 Tax=Muricoccus roseus TaxID=198092 RepID=A0A1M6PN32_9PROT|nr:RidA family protein [Roseomonas rosea]SHK09300.1 Enamine deaminase RidA, house cleaning of reactive enamine intermediates, YjgF/YER057c/UK114 family [Roseomonas rosea]